MPMTPSGIPSTPGTRVGRSGSSSTDRKEIQRMLDAEMDPEVQQALLKAAGLEKTRWAGKAEQQPFQKQFLSGERVRLRWTSSKVF